MNEVTVTNEDNDVIAHIFIENGEIKGIIENGYKVNVDGEDLDVEDI